MEWHFRNRRQNSFAYIKETIHFPLREAWSLTLLGGINDTPIYAEGAIFVSAIDQFYKLDATTGEINWSIKPDTAIRPSPAYYNGKVYFSSSAWGILYCVDSANGKEIWRMNTGVSAGSCRIIDNRIFLRCGKGKGARQVSGFACYSLESMSEIWFHSGVKGTFMETCAIENNILVYGDGAGNVYGINALTGTEIWKMSITEWLPPQKDQVNKARIPHATNPPIIVGDVVIIIVETPGQTFGLNLKTGKVLWSYKSEERIWDYLGMAVDNEHWYCLTAFRDNPKHYYAFDVKTGKVVAKSDISAFKEQLGHMNAFFRDNCFVVGDYHFVGIYDPPRVVAFNKHTGEVIWTHSVDRSNLRGDSQGIYADGKLIWVRMTGDIYCFD